MPLAAPMLSLSATTVMSPVPVVCSVLPALIVAPVPPVPPIAVTWTSPEPVVRIVFRPLPEPLGALQAVVVGAAGVAADSDEGDVAIDRRHRAVLRPMP